MTWPTWPTTWPTGRMTWPDQDLADLADLADRMTWPTG